MRKLPLLTAVLMISLSSISQNFDKTDIRRIGDYGKLWVALTLFHPQMAYNTINADSLFTDNISELITNPSAANFRNAVQKMIDRLHDPYTTIKSRNKNTSDSISLPNRPLLQWLVDSIAVLSLDESFAYKNQILQNQPLRNILDSVKTAHAVIIDIRKANPPDETGLGDYFQSIFIQTLISFLSDHTVGYPSKRTRIHYGHESDNTREQLYFKGWVMQNGYAVQGRGLLHKPVCLLINRHNVSISDALACLQNKHLAKIVADGNLDNFDPHTYYEIPLSDSVTVKMRLSEIIYADGQKKFTADTTISNNDAQREKELYAVAVKLLNNADSRKNINEEIRNYFTSMSTESYNSLAYPSAPLRLLGLMRYWSAIQYFCPNKDRITKNWDSVLYEYVPKFWQAKDSLDYIKTVARLITEIHDGHGFLGSIRFWLLNAKVPPLQLKYVEDKTVVYKVLNDTLKKDFSPGDEIIAVDNIPVKKFRDSIAQYIGASNNASLQSDVTIRLLAGKENTTVTINTLHNGKLTVTTLPRNKNVFQIALAQPENKPVWKKIHDNIGYVDFGKLQVPQIDSMFNNLKNTDAIILDDRSYPKGTVWTFVNYLTTKTVISAKATTMIADSPDPLTVTRQEQLWTIPVTPKALQYKGKIVILVNETTQSQAEYSCMVLQAAYKKTTIIGSQTAGADGDVTQILLPGGIYTAFSGLGVHYPNGRPTQGIGIIPDIKVKPTIKGIKAGRDEVLERAVQFAKSVY